MHLKQLFTPGDRVRAVTNIGRHTQAGDLGTVIQQEEPDIYLVRFDINRSDDITREIRCFSDELELVVEA